MSSLYAQSTIAMSSYNFIAFSRKACLASEILKGISTQHPEITEDEIIGALQVLVEKKIVIAHTDTGYDITDPKRRVVVERDRSDAGYDEDGNPIGGWNGWIVRSSDGSVSKMEVPK